MDAVELNYPVDVSKLRVTEDCEPLVTSSVERCSNSLRHKEGTSAVGALESWNKIPVNEFCRHSSQLPSCQGENLSEHHDSRVANCHFTPGLEVVPRKQGKVSRNGIGSSKRLRVAQLEDTVSSAGVDDVKNTTDKLGSYPTKCNSPEKSQTVKQKNSFSGKRGDKRNFKVAVKSRYDSFSMKSGVASFGMASGGNNLLGVYGLKADTQDITKLLGDISLNELIDGTFKCPSFGKDKGKKTAVSNENFLHSVRKACSVLPLRKPVQSQTFAEIESFSNKQFPTCPQSPVSLSASGLNGDKEECHTRDLSSCTETQNPCSNGEMPTSLLDFQLSQPKDVLERLALPPPKDLDSLLLDATKPSASSRNTSDIRSSKQITRHATLPPFPWSHAFTGHCRTNSDVVKCLTSRSTCQGRWVKIANTAISPGTTSDRFTDLESLAYDQNLVPLGLKHSSFESRMILSTGSLSFSEKETGVQLKDQGNAEHCPRLLAAAEALYDIATNSSRGISDGFLRPKRPLQKAMKARKSKSNEKPEDLYSKPSSVLGSDKPARSHVNQIMPLKRSKLSPTENKKDLSHINCVRKGPLASSTPRSSRSSPGKAVRDSIVEVRHSTSNFVKQPLMMHQPATVLDGACNSQHKLRKLTSVDWNRERDRPD